MYDTTKGHLLTPVISWKQVSKRSGAVKTWDTVNLDVAPETVCVVLGANGRLNPTADGIV